MARNPLERRYDDLVFCGGGTRCVWQGGFLSVFAPWIDPLRRINTVSAGTISALGYVSDQAQGLRDLMCDVFDEIAKGPGNVSLRRKLSGGPFFIYESAYAEMVRRLMSAAGALDAVADGPEWTVHVTRRPRVGSYAAMVAYALDLRWNDTPHVTWPRHLGARSVAVDMRAAARSGLEAVVELTVAAGSTPPSFAQHYHEGIPVIDGGLVDNAACPPDGHPLVLLTRPYAGCADRGDRTYVRPSRPIAVNKMDFTNAEAIRGVWLQGEQDARIFLEQHGHLGAPSTR
ncbi:patatin-like phospholipase family protein [Pontivivens insulae]|uniref:PNPLA domain-containing protein n=1 Tax=Pontivivens insulae TaxID=1639689 RepID=A0A2R8AAY9_9RHOB|nr:patatin-like phospholipase family protein [Pontivivens insulae]RED13108.1 patatin-like phospholipase [Pontivivens insulae]SPF29200.1 hypothetical protein POI8812_01507 [Pontivivens insulae]